MTLTLRVSASLKLSGAQELCESSGGRPELPGLDSPYGLFGRKATLNQRISQLLKGRFVIHEDYAPGNELKGFMVLAVSYQHWTLLPKRRNGDGTLPV